MRTEILTPSLSNRSGPWAPWEPTDSATEFYLPRRSRAREFPSWLDGTRGSRQTRAVARLRCLSHFIRSRDLNIPCAMKEDSAADSRAHKDVLAEWCQWHYLSITTGKIHGLAPVCPVWVITSAVPERLSDAVRGGERMFAAAHEKSIASLKRERDELKQAAQAMRSNGRHGPQHAGKVFTEAQASRLREVEELLSQTVTVNYRNPEADRSSIIEMLKRSKFRAMSYVDEGAARAWRYTVHENSASLSLGRDMALLSLLGRNSAEMVFIRSSTSGGSNIISQAEDSQAAFTLMTIADPETIDALAPRLRRPYAGKCKGRTLVCRAPAQSRIGVEEHHVYDVLRKSYATLREDDRLQISTHDDQAWREGLPRTLVDFVDTDAPDALNKLQATPSLLDVRHIADLVTRAAVTQALYEQAHLLNMPLETPGESIGADPERHIHLEQKHLDAAKRWARAIFREAYELERAEAKADRAARARDALSDKRCAEARAELQAEADALSVAIAAREDGMVSHTQATRHLGITAMKLRMLVEAYPERFLVLHDVKLEGAKKKASVAYAHRHDVELESDEPSETVYGSGEEAAMLSFWNDLHEEAVNNRVSESAGYCPAIDFWELEPHLKEWVRKMRQDPALARVTAFVPSGPRAEGGETGARALQLWFRYDPDGKEMCDWTKCHLKWDMARRWEEKDRPDS